MGSASTSHKQIFMEDTVAQKDDNAPSELARGAIIHSAACR